MRHLVHDESWINPVSLAEQSGRLLVESEQHHTDQKKQCELKQNRHS